MTKCVSPWYNRTGWLGVKHQFTYLLTPLAILASFGSSVFFWLFKVLLAIRVFLWLSEGPFGCPRLFWLFKVPLAIQGSFGYPSSFGYPRFLWFFRGFFWLSKVPLDLQGLFGYPWFLRLAEMPLAIGGFLWLSKVTLAIHGFLWLSAGSFGYPRVPLSIQGSFSYHGFLWLSIFGWIVHLYPSSSELAGCIGDKVPRLNRSYLCLD